MGKPALLVATTMMLLAPAAGADYDVRVDLENLSGEAKTNWPVILRVCHVFGRDLPAGSLDPKGYHVIGPDGAEWAHDVERIPPAFCDSNDELIFVVPSMAAGEKLSVRITNTAGPSPARRRLDVVGGAHNLVRNGGFEAGGADAVEGWSGQVGLDTAVKRSGKASMLMHGTGGRKAAHDGKIALHPGSYYYAGVWCRTENVSRYGVAAGRGAHFRLSGFEKVWGRVPTLRPQCHTRDWNKSRFFARYGLEYTDWGVDRGSIRAAEDHADLAIALDQKMQWCMTKPEGRWWLDDLVLIEQPAARVRFDLRLAPLMKAVPQARPDAAKGRYFLFTRPTNMPMGGEASRKFPAPWAAYPFAHEKLTRLDRWGLRGQRVPFLVGLYHTGELKGVSCAVAGKALTGPGGKVPLEFIEVTHGYINGPHHYMADYAGSVDFAGPEGVRYFVATFAVPADAKPGAYTGRLALAAGGEALAEVPLTLRVQDLALPALTDRYIGMIMQASPIRYNAETLRVYARSGFSCVTIFGRFLRYTKPDDAGRRHVVLAHLREQMALAKKHGLAAVCLYSDLQLDQKPRGPGPMHRYALSVPPVKAAWAKAREARDAYKAARDAARKAPKDAEAAKAAKAAQVRHEALEAAALEAEKQEYFRLIREVDAECRRHPDWPIIIHMNWDEPHGPHPRMGWTNECLPDALTTLDAGFRALPRVWQYYNMPALDDPCDFNGPELYATLKARGKRFGLAASHKQGEPARYQPGIWVATSGADYMHAWHLAGAGLMKVVKGTPLRSISMAAAGEGMDDLKTHALLTGLIARGLKSPDDATVAAAKAARAYLDEVFATFNGDGAHASGNPPHLGWVCTWGYERFYDDWAERMARHAARIAGVRWIE